MTHGLYVTVTTPVSRETGVVVVLQRARECAFDQTGVDLAE
jgi:hypothetical protein